MANDWRATSSDLDKGDTHEDNDMLILDREDGLNNE